MKTIKSVVIIGFLTLLPGSFLFSQSSGNGNPSSGGGPIPPTIVGISALDPTGAEPGEDTASFRVYRLGDVTFPLTISYSISGTASNGVDYQRIPDSITIPAGSESAIITITPIDDNLVEPTETVIITLNQNSAYTFSTTPDGIIANRAYVRIFDNETNKLPKVAIIQPTNGSVFQLPTNVVISAEARDEDGIVHKVGFFANGTLLGYVYNENTTRAVFTFVWQNPPAGEFVLKARAYDNAGSEAESEPVNISIRQQGLERNVVSVYVIDGEAEEIPPVPPGMGMPQRINNGVVRVHRAGATNFPLYVSYSLAGTAINGVDYERLSGNIVIPEGARDADLLIVPIFDELVEGTETVTVRIEPPVCITIYPPPPDCYLVGEPREATVKILDYNSNTTNHPPQVNIVSPRDGSVFTAPAHIVLSAEATDKDGFVKTVEFWANDKRLVIITNYPQSMEGFRPTNPFYFVWTNVQAGEYVLTAAATDDKDARSVSPPVKISVRATTNQLPIVTIEATDPEASEIPEILPAINPGIFTVRRTGSLDFPLTVYYKIKGTASNGVDYQRLPGRVEIPAGKASAEIAVIPIDDNLLEGTESVTLQLTVPEIIITIYPPPPPPYIIGQPGQATVLIYDNDRYETNVPPSVKIVKPQNNMTFIAPANIGLCAEARDIDGKVEKVEFYEGTNKLGEAISPATPTSVFYPYYFLWRNVGVGEYVLTAVATDDAGDTATSEPVKIRVIEPITNTIPIVRIEAIDAYASEGPITPIIMYSNYNAYAGAGEPEIITARIPRIDTATFLIKRNGPTNSELAVHYSIAGTASNGVDYLKLPGIAVIPAGERSTTVTIVPIDDSIPEGYETVVLKLVVPIPPPTSTDDGSSNPINSTNSPPYLIGTPATASAVIADNDLPPRPIKLPDGQFHFYRPAPTGMVYVIQTSADLINWTPVLTNTATDGVINYVDTDATDYKRRFYRVVPVQQ